MRSSLIGKIEKAKRYAQERERVSVSQFRAEFKGEHDSYITEYRDGKWSCTCHFFSIWKTCSHVMALQRILGEMLPGEARLPFDLEA